MTSSIRFFVSALTMGVLAMVARADVRLAPFFTEGMVLQREQPLRVWGHAAAGEQVKVEFNRETVIVTAASDGRWLAGLPPQAASSEGRELRVTGKNVIIVRDVVVGDVWICSGQSNMEFTVQNARDGKQEVARANHLLIRQIKISRKLSEQPLDDFAATPWRKAEPTFVGNFTAVGYFFARQMLRETNIPVGLINCTWSGTSIEPWMSSETLAIRPEFAVVGERWREDLAAYPERRKTYEEALAQWEKDEKRAKAQSREAHDVFIKEHRMPRPPVASPDDPYPRNPSAIFNGMVYPLRFMGIRGVLWYQGEANAVRAKEYAALFQASIRGWREMFGRPELPFYWVQIPNFSVETDWPRLREAQGKALALPETGQAVAIDIGDPDNLHPTNKQEVGHRLALIALAKLEHRALEFSGPEFSSAMFESGVVRVRFAHAAGLKTGKKPIAELELAGADRVFHRAEGKIDGEQLLVSSPDVPHPIAIRYAWRAAPVANLYNGSDLPAAPFRSDNW